MHPYPGGGGPLHNLADLIPLTQVESGSKPIVATEAGYHSEHGDQQRALPDLRASQRRSTCRGWRWRASGRASSAPTSSSSSIPGPTAPDDENRFGLLRTDLSRKPSFLSLRNLLRAVDADSAPVAAPGGLRLGIEGAPLDMRSCCCGPPTAPTRWCSGGP